MGLREDFVARRDSQEIVEKEVEFMGRKVYVRPLNAFWSSVIESQRTRVVNNQPVFDTTRDKVCFCILGMYDAPGKEGKLIWAQPRRVGFVDVNWSFSDERELEKFPSADVTRVAQVVAEISGMVPTAAADAEKNSPVTTISDSSSISPAN